MNGVLNLFFMAFSHYVQLMLVDPYLNTDAGTMSPFEHGEVFVLDDGGEVCNSPFIHLFWFFGFLLLLFMMFVAT